MPTKAEPFSTLLDFTYLPAFAEYLLRQRLREYAENQLRLSRAMDVPLLKRLQGLPGDELMGMILQSSSELLTYLSNNQAQAYIELSVRRWIDNQLPQVDRYAVEAEDITLITYVRKQNFLHFLQEYSRDAEQMLEVIREIDRYCLSFETFSANTYMNLLKNRIDEHSHFIQKINNTTPGAIYVFDVVNFKGIYSNGKLASIIGYDHEELNRLGPDALSQLVHPEDAEGIRSNLQSVLRAADGETSSYVYRIRDKDSTYRWVRNYEAVFKRGDDGRVLQTIGITLDVNEEKKVAEQLKQREAELLEAQEIAQLGNFSWDFEHKLLTGSPKMYALLELTPGSNEGFLDNVHPAARKKVEAAMAEALVTGRFECEYRYKGRDSEKVIWSKGIVHYRDGRPHSMTGTVMDVTRRTQILEDLRQNSERYQQAEAITHIGTYEIELSTQKVKFSEELFRIYDLEPTNNPLPYELLTRLRHPDDQAHVSAVMATSIRDLQPFDFYFRIVTGKGAEKILHARGEVMPGPGGGAEHVIGTIQDVTEKQTLIRKLRQSEHVYQQAEALANMGNYTWDLSTDAIEWTDQLYRIYGLEPQSERITLQRFISFVHPEDRPLVDEAVKNIFAQQAIDYTFRIVTTGGGVKTLRSIARLQHDEQGKPVLVIGTEQDVTEREKLIQSLEKSQQLYQQAQSIARLGNWTFNLQTQEAVWSDEMYRIYEMEPGEKVSFALFLSFVHPEDRQEVIDYFEMTIREKLPYNKRHRMITRNGKIKILHRKGAFRLDARGEIVEMYGTTQDVTEQLAVENELIEKQTFIQKITDATPSIITSHNVHTGRSVFVNEGLRKLLGYDPALAMEEGAAFFTALIHPDDRQQAAEKRARIIGEYNQPGKRADNSLIAEFTYRMRHSNGSYRWFQTYATIFDRNAGGLIEHMLNISLDITQQVEATVQVKEQQHFINHIADASPTILYLYNAAEGSFAYINREIFYVLGYTSKEILDAGAESTALLYHPDDYPLLPERRESTKKFQHPDSMMQYECRMKGKDGEWRWVLVREIIFKTDAEGRVVQLLGAALDITKRKEMEKTLLQNAFQLEQSNASLEEFAYVASHDLKEPLRKISTFGDRLVNTQMDKLTEEGRTYLRKIVDASQRMQTMINDLLSISMITGDRSFAPHSLQAILDEVLQTLEYKIEQKAAVIRAAPLPEARIIPSQFRQLFQNLLSNSLKFVRAGVQPVIAIRHSYVAPEAVEYLQLNKAPHYHKLEFRDNGIGFEDEYAGKIFAIFQRLHGRSEYEGTGIGLAICKKIVEHHGGAIYATGVPDEGATFTIILPA